MGPLVLLGLLAAGFGVLGWAAVGEPGPLRWVGALSLAFLGAMLGMPLALRLFPERPVCRRGVCRCDAYEFLSMDEVEQPGLPKAGVTTRLLPSGAKETTLPKDAASRRWQYFYRCACGDEYVSRAERFLLIVGGKESPYRRRSWWGSWTVDI